MKNAELHSPDAEVDAYRELREQISSSTASKELKRAALAMIGQTHDVPEATAVWLLFERIRTYETKAQTARRVKNDLHRLAYMQGDIEHPIKANARKIEEQADARKRGEVLPPTSNAFLDRLESES